MVGEDETYTETTTDDGRRMLFYVLDGGRDREGKQVYNYYAFIDYLTDKGVVVEIMGNSKIVLDGKVLAEFETDEFEHLPIIRLRVEMNFISSHIFRSRLT